MLIVDAHLDLSMNALQGNRDLLSSAHTIRTQEARTSGNQGTVRTPRNASRTNRPKFRHSVCPAPPVDPPHIPISLRLPNPTALHRGNWLTTALLERMGYVRIITDRGTIRQPHQRLADLGEHSDRRCQRLR